jgi:hypothetical protein
MRPPLRRLGPVRAALPAPGAPRQASVLQPALGAAAVFLVGAHLAFSRPDFEPISRVLFAIPGLIAIAEFYRYYRNAERKELPFNIFALFQFYVTFVFPSFIQMEFFDLNGPVAFTDSTRLSGSIAVAGGGLALYVGMRLGELLGWRIRPRLLTACPPFELPSGFPTAAWGYLGLSLVFVMILIAAPSLVPSSLAMVLGVSIAFDFAIGLGLARPDLLRGYWSQRLSTIAFVVGAIMGLLRGMLDPVIRFGVVILANRWASTRKLQLPMIAGLLGVYLLFQPVKHEFRARVWKSSEQVSYTDRVSIWATAFDRFWSSDDNQQKATDSAVGRVSELDPVMHAIQVVPMNVPYVEGQYWTTIFTAPIPRLIWPDKPTTLDLEQRYAVLFHRQTQQAARGTAILLPLLVDGYWNFGWAGIGIACILMGLWVGICQRLWAGEHWALKTMGVCHLGRLVVQGGLLGVYSGLFQHGTGLLAASWGVYAVARLFSNDLSRQAGQPLRQARTQPRRAAAR